MKNINKNSTWLSLSVISFLLFIISMYAIGFKFTTDPNNPTVETLSTIAQKIKNGGAAGFVHSSYGLLVSGLVFSSLGIMLIISKWIIDELNIVTKLPNKYWDYIFLGIVVLAVILIIAGAALYINRSVATDPTLSVNSGQSAGLFILVILTVPLNIIPLFMPNAKEEVPPSEKTETVIEEVVSEN